MSEQLSSKGQHIEQSGSGEIYSVFKVRIPPVGEGINEVEILQWLVKVGEFVEIGQAFVEVQSEKAVSEIPSPVSGTVHELVAHAGDIIKVGDVMAHVLPESKINTQDSTAHTLPDNQHIIEKKETAKEPAAHVPPATPIARKLALDLGVNLSQVQGSGENGRVTKEDVQHFAATHDAQAKLTIAPLGIMPNPAPPIDTPRRQEETVETIPLTGVRARIAEQMMRTLEVPTAWSFEEVDCSELQTLRNELKPEAEKIPVKLTYLPFIIKAVVAALKEFPYFNASLDMVHQEIQLYREYHIGIATATPSGLIVPVVRDANQLSMLEIASEITKLAQLAQERKLTLDQIRGSTFTITNYGSLGGLSGVPIINPPEVAIIGVGRIEKRPVVVEQNGDSQILALPMMNLSLAFDHRVLDGHDAIPFLQRIKELLEHPNRLLLHT